MKKLIDTIEKFLAHSEEKLEELSEKNQSLKQKEENHED
ncbi:SP_0009 family protein [Streptococcus dentapri]|uniref:SP_0009 family protein n=1 Tax=Streptococcus dentapri TaxID=573564 RepID=A0ABV8D216_9STRE